MNRIVLFLCLVPALVASASEPRAGATFKAGDGVHLSEETRRSIGLEVVDVGEQALPADVKFAAQIYRDADEGETKGFAYASGFVESNSARQLEARLPALVTAHDVVWTGTVERLDRMLEGAAGKMEVLIEIPDPLRGLKVGDFVSVVVLSPNASPSSVVVLPQSAVLRTAYGPFAFVLNGDHFLRTPITIGDDSGEYVEITDGLYSGDAVAARPVETLYLIELRATKGGGHCH